MNPKTKKNQIIQPRELYVTKNNRNDMQTFLQEMRFELIEMWETDNKEEYEIWLNTITKTKVKVNIVKNLKYNKDASRQEVVNEIIDLWYELRAIRDILSEDEDDYYEKANHLTPYDRYNNMVKRFVGEQESNKDTWRFVYHTIIDPHLLAYLEIDEDDRVAITQ